MRDYPSFKRAAIRYWELRRVFYNLALIPPSLLAYLFTMGLLWAGDDPDFHYEFLVVSFGLCALGANLCYSFAYVLEFIYGTDESDSRWLRYGRTTVFVGGLLFAIILALIGGRNIAEMEFHHRFKQINR
jgi:hypothetical protein